MAKSSKVSGKSPQAEARADRLKAALKTNLKRRKAQARVRKSLPSNPAAKKD